ncbi:hypothetical protein [Apibacter sp.]|uniref:hypothetical protein n=1 Tax=Apibacter sp. TaxID=2023709 RepID=UPI0025D379AA|nr:hypothetical protein [Apibacter sp.]MCT6869481.1 hypothetical protein [Apibacter sp.]
MSKLIIIPIIILLLQIAGYMFLFYGNKHGHADVPIAWIIFNILGIFNLIVLVLSYFLFFNSENKISFWWIPVTIAVITIIILIIQYIRMAMGKF